MSSLGRTEFDAGLWIDGRPRPGVASVLQNMESVSNYPSLDVRRAHAAGYDVVMTTSLDSDVPSTYLSWTGDLTHWKPTPCMHASSFDERVPSAKTLAAFPK